MNRKLVFLLMVFTLFASVDSAFASSPWNYRDLYIVLLAFYVSVPLLVLVFVSVGGIYLISGWKERYRKIVIRVIVGYLGLIILAYVISSRFHLGWLNDVGGFMLAAIPLFGVLIGVYMIYLGGRSLSAKRPPYLAAVRPPRMLISGVVLVAVIVACAVWLAFSFTTQMEKEKKLSEMRTLMTKIYEAETAYFAENNTFSADPAAIGLEPGGVTPKDYQYEIISADEKGFLARAWGNIDDDPDLEIWEVTEIAPTAYRVFSDVLNKGTRIDPHDPKRYTPR